MSKAATPAPVQDYAGAGPAAGDGVPLTADEVIRRGVVLGGRAVARLTVDFTSGQVTCELEPAADERADLKARILAKLRASPYAMTRKQLALSMGRPNAKGRYAQVVSGMVETGEIFERDGELTDDASKFSDETYS